MRNPTRPSVETELAIYTCHFCVARLESRIKAKLAGLGKHAVDAGTLERLKRHFIHEHGLAVQFSSREHLKRHLLNKHSQDELQQAKQALLEEFGASYLEQRICDKSLRSAQTQDSLDGLRRLTTEYQGMNADLREIRQLVQAKSSTMSRVDANHFFSKTHPADFPQKKPVELQIEATTHAISFRPSRVEEVQVRPLQLVDVNLPAKKHPGSRRDSTRQSQKENLAPVVATPKRAELASKNEDGDLHGLISGDDKRVLPTEPNVCDADEDVSANLSFQTNNGLISARDPFDQAAAEHEPQQPTEHDQSGDTLEEINVDLGVLNRENSFSAQKNRSGLEDLGSNLFKETAHDDFETRNAKTVQNKLQKKITFQNRSGSAQAKKDFRLKSLNEINSEFFADKSQAEKKVFDALHGQLKQGLDRKIESRRQDIDRLKVDINALVARRTQQVAEGSTAVPVEESPSLLSLLDESGLLDGSVADLEEALKQMQSRNRRKEGVLLEAFEKNLHLYPEDFRIKDIV